MKKLSIILTITSLLFITTSCTIPKTLPESEIETILEAPIKPHRYYTRYWPNKKGMVKKQISINKNKRDYYLYPTKDQSPNIKKPLIILLHGSQRTGASMVDMWRDVAKKHNVILVAPNAHDLDGWEEPQDNSRTIKRIIKKVSRSYNIDKKRIYLFGHSSGAIFALNIATDISKDIAAIAIHAGMFMNSEDSFNLADAERKIPFSIFVGSNDPLFPLDEVRRTANNIKVLDFPVKLNIIDQHNHWYYDIAPFINQKAWDFFEGERLD